jgi:hypothetical protein
LFKSELEKFVVKRITLFALIGSAVSLIFPSRWMIILGLMAGAGMSIFRFGGYAWIYGRITTGKEYNAGSAAIKSVLIFLANQILLIVLLFGVYRIHHAMFVGLVIGVLFAALSLIINSITEALGLTKNQFFM